MSELISRVEALEAIESQVYEHCIRSTRDPLSSFEFGWNEAVRKCARIIKDISAAPPFYKWRSVKEEPPHFPCLISDAQGNEPRIADGIITITDPEHGTWYLDGMFYKAAGAAGCHYENRIIAWAYLPARYNDGSASE